MNDPFTPLGLDASASADDVRAARRRLAKCHHPDAGGDARRMRDLNEAAASALRLIDEASAATTAPHGSQGGATTPSAPNSSPSAAGASWTEAARDMPSFVVEALPVETFEALLVATTVIGEVIDDDPPYRLDVLLTDPLSCWCRLELVPDAGASTVSITIGALDGQRSPPIEQVRDLWITQLNALDW